MLRPTDERVRRETGWRRHVIGVRLDPVECFDLHAAHNIRQQRHKEQNQENEE